MAISGPYCTVAMAMMMTMMVSQTVSRGFNDAALDCEHNPSSIDMLNYQNDEHQCWTFTAAPNHAAKLVCDTFCTERCCDNFYVYDGPNANYPLMARLAGCTSRSITFLAGGQHLYARFYSDVTVTARGVHCTFDSNPTYQPLMMTTVAPPTLAPNECVVIQNTHMRLVNTAGNCDVMEGRVEIFHQGQWGSVCDNGWNDNDARVVCRELGFLEDVGEARVHLEHGAGSGRIFLDDVQCAGSEMRLSECSASPVGSHNCGHNNDAGVSCEDLGEAEGSVRLVSHDQINLNHGRVEVYHAGAWGTICDDAWDNTDASVVCRALGYSQGLAYGGALFGAGSGDIWMDQVRCTGSEGSVLDCSANAIGTHDCSHREDASVICLI